MAIEAYSDEDAYTIFETMNDRGLSLSLPEMLKGYVLANITHEDDQRAVNATWKAQMQALREIGDEEDVDFFKDWLRARHAQTIRPGKKGAENKDFERIGSEFHRWVRDQKDQLGPGGRGRLHPLREARPGLLRPAIPGDPPRRRHPDTGLGVDPLQRRPRLHAADPGHAGPADPG